MVESVLRTGHGTFLVSRNGTTVDVPDDMANADRQVIAAWEAVGGVIEDAPPPPAVAKRYSKKALFEAMTEAEYATFETYEAQQSKKEARMFREATELHESDSGFAKVLGLMQAAYGEDRAAELLAAAEF